MNIFKILASGDGSINEPNVSAFLGYLLNPKADHGIGDELLKKVLHNLFLQNKQSSLKDFLVDRYERCRNLSITSNFEIEVLLEQAFKSNIIGKREIVDIVILCYEKQVRGVESLAQITLSNNNMRELKHIFLIENKIRDASSKGNQLINQCNQTIQTLIDLLGKEEEEVMKLLSIIFVSPDGSYSNEAFQKLVEDKKLKIPKLHIYWSQEEEEDSDEESFIMTTFLKEILFDETAGIIETINEYTKATLKSFIAFIENDFKSAIEEELEGETKRDIGYDFKEYKAKYQSELSTESWKLAEDFRSYVDKNYKDVIVRHSRTHPITVMMKDGKGGSKIFSLTKAKGGKQLNVHLVYRNYPADPIISNALITYLSNKGLSAQNKPTGFWEIKSTKIMFDTVQDCFNKQYNLMKNTLKQTDLVLK